MGWATPRPALPSPDPLARALGPLALAVLFAAAAGSAWRAADRSERVNAEYAAWRGGGPLPEAPPPTRPEGVDRRPLDPDDAPPPHRLPEAAAPPGPPPPPER